MFANICVLSLLTIINLEEKAMKFPFWYIPKTRKRQGHIPKLSEKTYEGDYWGDALDEFKKDNPDVRVTKWERVDT